MSFSAIDDVLKSCYESVNEIAFYAKVHRDIREYGKVFIGFQNKDGCVYLHYQEQFLTGQIEIINGEEYIFTSQNYFAHLSISKNVDCQCIILSIKGRQSDYQI